MHGLRFLAPVLLAVFGTPSAFAAGFNDVPVDAPYAKAILALQEDGLLGGYSDGSYRPYRSLNRAEFIKLLVAAKIDPRNEDCKTMERPPFADVPASAWFARAVCAAKKADVVTGFADGTFQPAKQVTLAEASMMLAKAFTTDVPSGGSPWYRPGIETLVQDGAVPPTLGNPDQTVTRGEFAEMVWRLRENRRDLECPTVDDLLGSTCQYVGDRGVVGADVQEAERVWLQWTNAARAELGLPAYAIDRQLQRTALLWSRQAAGAGAISHKRAGQSAYYDYNRMVSWFEDQGLEFENRSRVTFTENIGWGVYACRDEDCTDDLIRSIRTTFDFYMSEKGKEYRPHYNSIVNPQFRQVGVGLALDPAGKRYYLTVHYGTEIASNPAPVCL